MKLSKIKKIILLGATLGLLTTAIITPVLLLNTKKNNDQENQNKKNVENVIRINEIKEKIINKNILIAPNVSTSNQNEIESAIKNQLQKENILLNNDDLSKISFNLPSLNLETKTKVILNINVGFQNLTIEIYVKKANLLKNSNIVDGNGGTIFQDSFGNLWAMSTSITKDVNGTKKTIDKKLQVLKINESGDGYVNSWTNDNDENGEPLLKGSNIINGQNGTIFQDEFKNLWAMGNGTSLQVLRANENGDGYDESFGWTSANKGLTKGSNITDGKNGVIFQDEFRNLWTMSIYKKLQVLRVNENGDGYDKNVGWTNANSGLTKGSNITDGFKGTIFQDQFKNLWTMGNKKLQVLRANENGDGYNEIVGWTSAIRSGLTKNSNIIYGNGGTIFQDEFKNLWAMGYGTRLQVLRANDNGNGYNEIVGWTSANSGLTRGSNVIDGWGGMIFQDQFKNLWIISYYKKLQVLKANQNQNGYDEKNGWTNDNSGLTKGSNIIDGQNGVIFQDQFKNLWAMGYQTKLQVLKANPSRNGYDEVNGWSNDNNGLTKNLSINDGLGGTIFQDEFKNLWAMGASETKTIDGVEKTIHTKLQVLKGNIAKDGYVDSWQKPSN